MLEYLDTSETTKDSHALIMWRYLILGKLRQVQELQPQEKCFPTGTDTMALNEANNP